MYYTLTQFGLQRNFCFTIEYSFIFSFFPFETSQKYYNHTFKGNSMFRLEIIHKWKIDLLRPKMHRILFVVNFRICWNYSFPISLLLLVRHSEIALICSISKTLSQFGPLNVDSFLNSTVIWNPYSTSHKTMQMSYISLGWKFSDFVWLKRCVTSLKCWKLRQFNRWTWLP